VDVALAKAVALAGLLHDIGKFLQRAGVELCDQSKNMEGYLCPSFQGRYTHRHVLWTDHFFREVFDESLVQQVFGSLSPAANIANLAAYHHNPEKDFSLQRLIQQADMLSAREREEEETQQAGGTGPRQLAYKKLRLSSVFEEIDLGKGQPRAQLKYRLAPLTLGEEVFPAELPEDQDLETDYKRLWEGFQKEFSQVQQKIANSRGDKFDILFSATHSLLHKYTWCIPSFTQYQCNISLFDHLRTTSAIAICLYLAQTSAEKSEQPFLLVEGDISGIQNFIYRLASPTGVAHVARILRGRSFYLTLLPLVIAKHIISRVGLTIANILWCGGGKFDLLLPNTVEAQSLLAQIQTELDDWFFKEFEAELGVVFGEVAISAEEDDWKDFGAFLDKVRFRVEDAKERKFMGKVTGNAGLDTGSVGDICRVCGLYQALDKDESICSRCSLERSIGSYLPGAKYIVFCRARIERAPGSCQAIEFGKFGTVYLIEESEDEDKVVDFFLSRSEVTDILAINQTDGFPLGFTLIGKEVARATEAFSDQFGAEVEEGHILPFEQLAQMAEGDQRLGVLKMDVDHLGLIFAYGLPADKRTISRIATLSRMLDWFFCGYVNTIAKQVFADWRRKNIRCNFKGKVEGCVYTVYSGGDDLLIVAPWSEAIEFAASLHRDFKRFTSHNPDVDLSAGLFLCKPKFTISRAAVLAGDALSKSKDSGRKKICLLGDVVPWDNDGGAPGFHDLLKLSHFFVEHLTATDVRKKLPRRFLHSLLGLRRRYVSDGVVSLNYIPLLLYIITRNVGDEGLKLKLMEYFIAGDMSAGCFHRCLVPASIALLKTR